MNTSTKAVQPKVKLICNECGETRRASADGEYNDRCPKCGGVDWDVVEEHGPKKIITANLQETKDNLAVAACGITAAEAWAKGICIDCKEPAAPKCHTADGHGEYRISAMCEECFDKMFADEEE